MRHVIAAGLVAGAALGLAAGPAQAETYNLKIAHFVTPKHPFSKWLVAWSKKLEQQSGGALKFTIIPGSQMGPPPKYYDIARRGQADFTWFLHGFTPGRFPLTEISNLPYLFGSAEIGTKTLNDAELRSRYLDKEHKGVKVLILFSHQPGNIHSANKPVRRVEDMKGLRIRFASATIKDFVAALGGTPVGLPPTQIVESMQKGTIDGAFIDYGGAGIAFRMGPVTKHTTEMYSYVASFGLAMNTRAYKRLPAKYQKMIDASVKGVEKDVGSQFDNLDPLGKRVMIKAGTKPIALTPEEDKRFRAIGAKVAEAKLAALEKRGLPARKVYKMMQALSAKHTPTSHNFWK